MSSEDSRICMLPMESKQHLSDLFCFQLYRLLEEQLKEIRHLSDLLTKEKQIFITLNQDGGGGSGGRMSAAGGGGGEHCSSTPR